jgi:uncharacterized protein (DUF1697 family)
MPTYVALLRGIAPTNPNMRNEKLCRLFEELGFTDVKSVISSGNIIFSSPATSIEKLEEKVEKVLPEKLHFTSTTIIRSKENLQKLMDDQPFKELEHSQKTSLNVTFLKQKTKNDMKFPHKVEGRMYSLLGLHDKNAICSVVDLTGDRTPDLMVWLEKNFGKEITTRSWKTVERIVKAME